MPELVYLNGEIIDFASALVSVDDRGYHFGDGIYEVIPVYQGHYLGLDWHLERLYRSAAEIYLTPPHQLAEFASLLKKLQQQSALSEAMVYIQITRGTYPRAHVFPLDLKPNVLVTVRCFPDLNPSLWDEGIYVITTHDGRWDKCHIKSISLLANILAKHLAREADASEAVFVRDDGTVTESASSNVFAVIDGTLTTHPENNRILAGITRKYVLEIARAQHLPVREDFFTIDDLRRAQEVMITSSIQEVVPVVRIDSHLVGNGKPGPIAKQLLAGYRQRITAELKK